MAERAHVRELSSKAEENEFSEISKYCFNDLTGWTGRIFPLRFGDRAWGWFEGDTLASGVITRSFDARIFSTWQKMAGIAMVQSLPEHRNKDNVSELLRKCLREAKDEGAVFSSLYPFKFGYYEKYGYGYIGGFYQTVFQPNDIDVQKPESGELVPFDGSSSQLRDIARVAEKWVSGFSFGIKPRMLPHDAALEELEWSKDRIVLYYDGSECRGYIRLLKIIVSLFVTHIEIRKIAWSDDYAFRALLFFIKKHRDQVREVKWTIPQSLPLWLSMAEPRIQIAKSSDWMARPLDLPVLLGLKAKAAGYAGELRFSVEDPEIPENTGTYTVAGQDVRKEPHNGENTIALPVLSSLLFGGYSLSDARLAGRVNREFPRAADDFFIAEPRIFLSEFF